MYWTIVRKFDRPAKTECGLIRKINRRLPEHHMLHKSRSRWQVELGNYYVADEYNNGVVASHIDDLQKYLDSLDVVVA